MSNLIRTMEKHSRGIKPADLKAVKGMDNGPKAAIDFGNKTLDKALYVKVPTNEFKVGNSTDIINDIPVAFTVGNDPSASYSGLLEFLDNLDANNITRVILDNVTDFKVMSFDELRNGVISEVAKRNAAISPN